MEHCMGDTHRRPYHRELGEHAGRHKDPQRASPLPETAAGGGRDCIARHGARATVSPTCRISCSACARNGWRADLRWHVRVSTARALGTMLACSRCSRRPGLGSARPGPCIRAHAPLVDGPAPDVSLDSRIVRPVGHALRHGTRPGIVSTSLHSCRYQWRTCASAVLVFSINHLRKTTRAGM